MYLIAIARAQPEVATPSTQALDERDDEREEDGHSTEGVEVVARGSRTSLWAVGALRDTEKGSVKWVKRGCIRSIDSLLTSMPLTIRNMDYTFEKGHDEAFMRRGHAAETRATHLYLTI